jgi:hypothetical protein
MRVLMIAPLLLLTAATPPLSVSLEDADGVLQSLPGASADAVNDNCLSCHSAGMIRYQPALTQVQWTATLTKMRTLYKAPIDPADEAAILTWLNAYSATQKSR